MKAIGPTFADELRNAGVTLDGFSWGSDGSIIFNAGVSQQVRDQVAAVYSAHDPSLPASKQTAGAAAMLSRQRADAVDQLDSAISALPAAQQPAFRLIQQLLKE